MEQAHDVKHPVEITLVANRDGRSPELFDERLFIRTRGCRKTADSGRRNHADGMASGQWLSIQSVSIRKRADAFADEKFLNAIA
jgi:hypothetical protein